MNTLCVCQNIEFGLKSAYEKHPGLTDLLCINGLENAAIAVKKEFGFAKNEQVAVVPGSHAELKKRSEAYFGQLAAYADCLQEVSSKAVAKVLHYPVAGYVSKIM